MRTRTTIGLIVFLSVSFAMAGMLYADVPPPPVDQTLGIWDADSGSVDQAGCIACHLNGVKSSTLHHALWLDGVMDCSDCHIDSSGTFIAITGCFSCHESEVHHLTDLALTEDCAACHTSLVQNAGDGHYIPTYSETIITPKLSSGEGPGGMGSCKYCHDAGTDTATGKDISLNSETHHGTGIGDCTLCHLSSTSDLPAIRGCENCHGVRSLHNIQVDTNGNGVLPGSETAGYGHIGSNDDCKGCHQGFDAQTAADLRAQGILYNPDRHHVKVALEGYQCLDCHKMTMNAAGEFVFDNFRSCSLCHGNKPGGSTTTTLTTTVTSSKRR